MVNIVNQHYIANQQQKHELLKRDAAGMAAHAKRINRELKEHGANGYDMMLPETQSLPSYIFPDEKIEGVVYGKYRYHGGEEEGRAVFVATPHRVLLLDRKPWFKNTHEFTYRNVGGISYKHIGFAGTVSLNTRMGNIYMRTFNSACARSFVQAVEDRIFLEDQGPL